MTSDDKYEYRHANGSRFCHPKGDPRYVAPDAGTTAGGIDAKTVALAGLHEKEGLCSAERPHLPLYAQRAANSFAVAAALRALAGQSLPASGEVERQCIKDSFYEGYAAARNSSVDEAWEDADVRHAIDYPTLTALTPVTSHADAGEWVPVLYEIVAERARQVAKGYTAAHDDEHDYGDIASQAAKAIGDTGREWVTADDPRTRLIQGIALAVAEVERLDRRNLSPRAASSDGRL